MYNIEFYETVDGVSELWDFLDDLQRKSSTNKDARIQQTQKTPRREIEKAKSERDDWISRKG